MVHPTAAAAFLRPVPHATVRDAFRRDAGEDLPVLNWPTSRLPATRKGRELALRNPERIDAPALEFALYQEGFVRSAWRRGPRGAQWIEWHRDLLPGYRFRVSLVSPRRPGRADFLAFGLGVLVCSNGLTLGPMQGERLSHAQGRADFLAGLSGTVRRIEGAAVAAADWTRRLRDTSTSVPLRAGVAAGLRARIGSDGMPRDIRWVDAEVVPMLGRGSALETYNAAQGLATGRIDWTPYPGTPSRRSVPALGQVGVSLTRAAVSEAVREALAIPALAF
jgi:hypothetical protein